MTHISNLLSDIPGIEAYQEDHIFGSINNVQMPFDISYNDEIEVIEKCFSRVKHLGSEMESFFATLDAESWVLVSSWQYLFSGLNSRHCMVAGFINGTGVDIQLKTTKLVQGGSP